MGDLIKYENGRLDLDKNVSRQIAKFEKAIKDLKESEDALKAKILSEMEDKNIIKLETEDLSITYIAPSERETFDSKKLKSDDQDTYDKYIKMTPVKSSIRIKVLDNGNIED